MQLIGHPIHIDGGSNININGEEATCLERRVGSSAGKTLGYFYTCRENQTTRPFLYGLSVSVMAASHWVTARNYNGVGCKICYFAPNIFFDFFMKNLRFPDK